MKVLFLAAYSKLGASSRTRVYDYFPYLEKEGIKYKYICFTPSFLHRLTSWHKTTVSKIFYFILIFLIKTINTFRAIILAPNYDIIFVQKIIFPFGIERILKLSNKKIIFDFDDAIFTDELEQKNFINSIKHTFQKKGFKNILKVSDLCLVENEYNREVALKYCPIVEIITGPIDTKKYFPKENIINNDKTVVGWTGSPSTSKYLLEIKDELRQISSRDDVIFRFIGVGRDFKIKDINYESEDWDFKKEVSLIQTFDIGIMPLPDNGWTKGKGGYKLLQYMACGIPAVASPVGINKEIIKDGINGFWAPERQEWVDKISILIKDKELRKKMGVLARKEMEENYSLEKASMRLIKIFKKLLYK